MCILKRERQETTFFFGRNAHMLLNNFFSRTCFAPDEGGGGASVHDDTVDVVREDATVNGGGDRGEEGQETVAADPAEDDDGGLETEANVDWGAFFKTHGLPTDPRQLTAGFTQLKQRAAEADQIRRMLWQQSQQMQQRPQAPPPTAEVPKQKMPWDIPGDFDPSMMEMLYTDAEGNILVKPGGDPTLPDRFKKWDKAQKAAQQKFLSDPYGSLKDGFMPLIQQEAQRIVQEQFQQQQSQQYIQSYQARLQKFEAENKSWTHDPITGGLTPMGRLWDDNLRYHASIGHRDPFAAADAAVDAELARQGWMQQEQQPATPPPTQQQQQLAFLKGRAQQGRGGSMRRPNGKKSPPQDYDPFKKLREDLAGVDPADFRQN